jgi:hypothetical protein
MSASVGEWSTMILEDSYLSTFVLSGDFVSSHTLVLMLHAKHLGHTYPPYGLLGLFLLLGAFLISKVDRFGTPESFAPQTLHLALFGFKDRA